MPSPRGAGPPSGKRDARRAITARRSAEDGEARSRNTWAKNSAHVDTGEFNHAVAGLRADLADHPLTKGVLSSD